MNSFCPLCHSASIRTEQPMCPNGHGRILVFSNLEDRLFIKNLIQREEAGENIVYELAKQEVSYEMYLFYARVVKVACL